jgi:AbiTii
MVGFYQNRLSDDFTLVNAWQEVTKGTIVGLLDMIRTRILEMALEIKSTVGKTDDALRHVAPAKVKSVKQTIINHIGTMVVAGGNANVRSNIQNTAITVGDWKQLEAALKNLSVPNSELTQLSEPSNWTARRRSDPRRRNGSRRLPPRFL